MSPTATQGLSDGVVGKRLRFGQSNFCLEKVRQFLFMSFCVCSCSESLSSRDNDGNGTNETSGIRNERLVCFYGFFFDTDLVHLNKVSKN